MSAIGAAERRTQKRVVSLFGDALKYAYQGNLGHQENENIVPGQLEHFLHMWQGYAEREDGEILVRRAIETLIRAAGDSSKSLYDRNREVYTLLRYGVQVKPEVGAQSETVWLIDWKRPERNQFAVAEEVTVRPTDPRAHAKRPDLVLYVNGIALAVLELKRSTISVTEGIRQNLDNQKKAFIQPFFSTVQLVMARGLTPLAKAQLKARWGTLRKVLSSRSRLEQIVADILFDMETKDRLANGRGNAMLVAGSIYEACKLFELFAGAPLAGRCAVVTSYVPDTGDIKGEDSGEGDTDRLEKHKVYRQMLADWFDEPPEKAVHKVEAFEKAVKKKFVEEPGQMKLLIVVDKLLTGFDAPPATYLYIDKKMRDHGLFQAICRVNRLDGEDKEYGYVVDYKDLFRLVEGAVRNYTSGALDGYAREDVEGLIDDRLDRARERLEESLEAIRALCEPVEPPRDEQAYYRYFSSDEPGDAAQLQANEPQRLALYKKTSALVRAYANLANEMSEAGYTEAQAKDIKREVTFYEDLRNQVKLHSGDAIDLKRYEPAMRHLIDTYIRAEESETVSEFDDLSLVQLIVQRGDEAVNALPRPIRDNKDASAETIENNVRKLIIDESPINPKYYERMSELLDALIAQRKEDALSYQEYLAQIVALTRQAQRGPATTEYPAAIDTSAKQALYDNLENDATLALRVDAAVRDSIQDGWRENILKTRRVRQAIQAVLGEGDERLDTIVELARSQHDY